MVITIDGLGVNGKSTLAKRISNKLNFKNFNTGAIYRCIALQIIENKLDCKKVAELDASSFIILKKLPNERYLSFIFNLIKSFIISLHK